MCRKFLRMLLLVPMMISCQSVSQTPESQLQPAPVMLKPGDQIGAIKLVKGEQANLEDSIFNFCDPQLGSQFVTLTIECQVTRSDYLFVGYGEVANSIEDLNEQWLKKRWELSIDGMPVDLAAFGTLDVDLGRNIRVWNIALENIPPGLHVLRYKASEIENPQHVTDLTWSFTVADQTVSTTPTSSPLPTPSSEPGVYPLLSSEVNLGMHPYRSDKANFNFMFYVPASYQADTQQKMPLILYLHGTGLRGDDLDKLRIGEFTAILQYEPDLPFLVVAPQLPANDENRLWSMNDIPERLFQLLAEVQEIYPVDSKRIYLTGSSIGGEGTWEIGLNHPKYFAALVPVMGFYGYPFRVPENICDLKDVPVWAFHGDTDLTVPLEAEQGLVDALRACGGNAQFTIYPGAGHNVDAQVYKMPELFEWMLAQSLK